MITPRKKLWTATINSGVISRSENESARGTDSEDGGFVHIKRRRLELP